MSSNASIISRLIQPRCVVGKALENYNSNDIGTIEVLVGSL